MTYKEIEDFIKNNNIRSREELRKNSRKAYDSFYTLTKEEKDCLLPLLDSNNVRTDLVTVDDFRSFIVTENITSRRDLRKRFCNVSTRFGKFLTKEEQDSILPPKIRPRYVGLKTVNDFKKFVAENNIQSRRNLSSRFPAAYYKFLKFTETEKDEILSNTYRDWSSINTKEDIKRFIEENNIQSRNELNLRFSQVSRKFLALSEQDKDELLPLILNYYSDIKTKDDIKKFIDDNNIQGRKELSDKFQIVYKKFLTILTTEERDELLPSTLIDYSNINTIDDFKEFIECNKIISRMDFYNRFRNAYYKFLNILTDDEKNELFNPSISSGEAFLIDLLESNNINFTREKTFDDLIDVNCLRYDFFLDDYNIIVEYHGKQHFNETSYFHHDCSKDHDKMKYDYAVEHGITILYYTNERSTYEKFGYFTEVITDADVLIQKIKEIGLTTQSNS